MSVTKIAIVRRRGFTLVELLVVIAIIGVLMGLLMPAIVNARLAALQTTCANNEKELAQAMILFDSNKDRLPYVGRSDSGNHTWYTQILEELGQGKLAENLTVQAIKQFKCPVGDASANGFSYVGNVGSKDKWNKYIQLDASKRASSYKQYVNSGLLYYGFGKNYSYTKSSISMISDGASETILLSEKLTSKLPGGGATNSNYSPTNNWLAQSGAEATYTHFGLSWNGSEAAASSFAFFPTSRHSQINNVAFADGSVRAINKSIYYNTYISLMCPKDSDCNVSVNLGSDPNYN